MTGGTGICDVGRPVVVDGVALGVVDVGAPVGGQNRRRHARRAVGARRSFRSCLARRPLDAGYGGDDLDFGHFGLHLDLGRRLEEDDAIA